VQGLLSNALLLPINPLNLTMKTIADHIAAFQKQPELVVETVETQLARAKDANGEGSRVFLSLNETAIRESAQQSMQRYRDGSARVLEGVTISIKDLFDVKGEVTTAGSTVLRVGGRAGEEGTTAGSTVLRSRAPASEDAPAVARLREAGAILVGRTNMTEFAFSGIGINPHYGTPRNVWGRRDDGGGRIPGGSSSGGGVSVADGMCTAALGSDTGGSVRIPAALNGVFGFKPTAYRVPVVGSVPLSVLSDSMGPIANSIDDCVRIDAVLSNEKLAIADVDLRGVKLLRPQSVIWQQLDPEVERATLVAIERLRQAGATIVDAPLEVLDEVYKFASTTGSALVLDWHNENIGVNGEKYDPLVWQRMLLGKDATREQMSRSLANRRFWIDRMNMALADYDAVICPTCACIAPEIAPLANNDEVFFAANSRILRNTNWVNALNGCAATIPVHARGEAPVGLQIVGSHAADTRILSIAKSVEIVLQQ
jgi:aspartyl-tRNA(Asn)/glutamyl-tRNA(Gln) amidotransferase subunit A